MKWFHISVFQRWNIYNILQFCQPLDALTRIDTLYFDLLQVCNIIPFINWKGNSSKEIQQATLKHLQNWLILFPSFNFCLANILFPFFYLQCGFWINLDEFYKTWLEKAISIPPPSHILFKVEWKYFFCYLIWIEKPLIEILEFRVNAFDIMTWSLFAYYFL